MYNPETKIPTPDTKENDPTQVSLLSRFRHGPLSTLAERFRDGEMPQTLSETRAAFEAIDRQWWDEAGYEAIEEHWYLDENGGFIVIGEAQSEHLNKLGEPTEGSPINRRIMVGGEVIDFTTLYYESDFHVERDDSIEKHTAIENIYDFSRVKPEDMTEGMRMLIATFGERLDATTVEFERREAYDRWGRDIRELPPIPDVPVRTLGDKAYRFDYVEDVVNIKGREYEKAEEVAYIDEATAQLIATQALTYASDKGLMTLSDGTPVNNKSRQIYNAAIDMGKSEVTALQEVRASLEEGKKLPFVPASIHNKRVRGRARKAEEAYRGALRNSQKPGAPDSTPPKR